VVRSLIDEGSTVLLTTQYLEEADALADDISMIDHGQVIAQGTPDELKRVVGGQTLTVRTAEDDRIDDAARVLADVTGTAPHHRREGLLSIGRTRRRATATGSHHRQSWTRGTSAQVRRRARGPVGRVLCTRRSGPTAIHLGLPLLTASCGLPASIGRAHPQPLAQSPRPKPRLPF
jgi:ABC-type glutathione transport system ATPase component